MPVLTRRQFVAGAAAGSALLIGGASSALAAGQPLSLPLLPFDEGALAPVISADTVRLHYGKHHAGYFAQLAPLVANTAYEGLSLAEIVVASAAKGDQRIFNNAGQALNHTLYWEGLRPGGASRPGGALAQAIERDFSSVDALKDELHRRAAGLFGSGWVWLVDDGGKLGLVETANAGTPLTSGKRPLMVIDVWEHAYYLDYQNRRADHVRAVIDKLINWDVAGERLAR